MRTHGKFETGSFAFDKVSKTSEAVKRKTFSLSMDPLYPTGLDDNRAVDDLYPASWICSEIMLLHRKKFRTVQ